MVNMVNILGIWLTTIFFPVVMASAVDSPVPPDPIEPDPVLVYAAGIQEISDTYVQVLFGLSELSQQLCENPLVIRSPEFYQGTRQIIGAILVTRLQLDNLPSPSAVEEIHEEFEAGAKLLVRAGVEIDNFTQRHDFDDFVDASELVARSVARWQGASDALSLLIENETQASGVQALAVTAADPSVLRYAEEIRQITVDYTEMLLGLGALTQQLCTNPPVVNSDEFDEEVQAVVESIHTIRGRLDAVSSPDAVGPLHGDFELAGDLFVLASEKIENFTIAHRFDELADATELIGAALSLWQTTNAKLAALIQGSGQ